MTPGRRETLNALGVWCAISGSLRQTGSGRCLPHRASETFRWWGALCMGGHRNSEFQRRQNGGRNPRFRGFTSSGQSPMPCDAIAEGPVRNYQV